MKTICLNTIYFSVAFFLGSCQNNEKVTNPICHLIDCANGDIVQLKLLKKQQNLLELDPVPEINFTQNNTILNFDIDTVNKELTLFVTEEEPISISVDDQLLNLSISANFIDGVCCYSMEIYKLKIDNLDICNNTSCNDVVEIQLNKD